MTVSMSRSHYEALLAAAMESNEEAALEISTAVDAENSIRRYIMWIRWVNVGGAVPSRVELGVGWPPEQTFTLRMERPISRLDVEEVLAQRAVNPASVMVTRDRRGVTGWTLLDAYVF